MGPSFGVFVGTAAISYPEKIAFPAWSYNGAEREERRMEIFSVYG
jgi:hypothetical protein